MDVSNKPFNNGPCMSCLSCTCPVFAQPIVSRAKPEMLKSHFIPTMEKLKKRSGKVVAEEEQLRLEGKSEVDSEEGTIRDEFAVLCRDLYALYPLLIRYVDNNRYVGVINKHVHTQNAHAHMETQKNTANPFLFFQGSMVDLSRPRC